MLQGAEIGDGAREREGELLRFRAAGGMNDAPVGNGKRTGEALTREIGHEAGKDRRNVGPGHRALAAQSNAAERTEAEADGHVLRREATGLDQSGEQARGVLRLNAEVEIDGDAGIEMNIVQRRADRGAAGGQRITVIADRALKHEGDAVGAVGQVVEDLRIGGLGVGEIDSLHDRPGLARWPARDAACLRGAAVKRLDADAVIGLGPERGKGRALQRLFDQRLPCRLVGRGKVPGQGAFHHCRQAYRCAYRALRYLSAKLLQVSS